MNQQAVPSIVVSVFIVGFFTVALFPREPDRSRRVPGNDPIAGPVGSRRPRDDEARSSPSRSGPIIGGPIRTPIENRADTRESPRPSAEVASPSLVAAGTRPLVRRTSKVADAGKTPSGQPAPTVGSLPQRPQKAHQPSQAVTVAGAGETISDVALRVYGTTRQADALWRANRDALPQRDSPLVPGTLLRTPIIR